VRFEAAANSGSEHVDNHEADVMSITGILFAGITQTDDQPRRSGQRVDRQG